MRKPTPASPLQIERDVHGTCFVTERSLQRDAVTDFVTVVIEGDGYSTTPNWPWNLVPGRAPPPQILLSDYEEGKANPCFVINSRRTGPLSFHSSQLPRGPGQAPPRRSAGICSELRKLGPLLASPSVLLFLLPGRAALRRTGKMWRCLQQV